jgi:lipopolysaccharide/colanic/teichoic acid biosynthesis glycosyltransferase
MYKIFFKDVIDFYLALILSIVLFPLILIIYIILYILMGSPIYLQKRPGYLNRSFVIFKFKTMIDRDCKKCHPKLFLRFANVLRKTGLDELPQLLNILKGEMSLIGPRPLLMKYLKISKFSKHIRNKCNPGITGLAQLQVYKKNSKYKWKIQLELDRYYVENLSIILDIKIIFITFLNFFLYFKKDYFNEKPLANKNF